MVLERHAEDHREDTCIVYRLFIGLRTTRPTHTNLKTGDGDSKKEQNAGVSRHRSSVFGSGDQRGYDAAHTAACSVASAHTLSSKYNYGNSEDGEEDEQQFILEHIVTPVSIVAPKITHVFTSCVMT